MYQVGLLKVSELRKKGETRGSKPANSARQNTAALPSPTNLLFISSACKGQASVMSTAKDGGAEAAANGGGGGAEAVHGGSGTDAKAPAETTTAAERKQQRQAELAALIEQAEALPAKVRAEYAAKHLKALAYARRNNRAKYKDPTKAALQRSYFYKRTGRYHPALHAEGLIEKRHKRPRPNSTAETVEAPCSAPAEAP
jgi:hypothetical protein